MYDWVKKTVVTFGTMVKDTAKNAANTPAPIGKTVAVVLVVEGVVIVTFLVTHKVKFITVLG
jgi:hypothetical protein